MCEFKTGEKRFGYALRHLLAYWWACACACGMHASAVIIVMAVVHSLRSPLFRFSFSFVFYCAVLLFVQLNADNRKQKQNTKFAKQRHPNVNPMRTKYFNTIYTCAEDTTGWSNAQGRMCQHTRFWLFNIWWRIFISIHGSDKQLPQQMTIAKPTEQYNSHYTLRWTNARIDHLKVYANRCNWQCFRWYCSSCYCDCYDGHVVFFRIG